MATAVGGNLKAPLSLAVVYLKAGEGITLSPWICQLTLDPFLSLLSTKQRGINQVSFLKCFV